MLGHGRGGQSLEQGARQPDLLEHDRVSAEDQQALDHDHRVPGLELEHARDLGARPRATEIQQLPLHKPRLARVRREPQEPEAHLSLAVGRNEGTLALAAVH